MPPGRGPIVRINVNLWLVGVISRLSLLILRLRGALTWIWVRLEVIWNSRLSKMFRGGSCPAHVPLGTERESRIMFFISPNRWEYFVCVCAPCPRVYRSMASRRLEIKNIPPIPY